MNLFLTITSLLLFVSIISCDVSSHKYQEGEEVFLFVNRVGPFRNPQETYSYHSLPFCQNPKHIETKNEGLGEALLGYELVKGPFLIQFKKDTKPTVTCTKIFSEKQSQQLTYAIKNQYWYQLFLDDLPIWGMVGEVLEDGSEERVLMFSHQKFVVTYNGDRVIEVNLTSENPKAIVPNKPIEFTYSVNWYPTNTEFEDRFNKYLDDSFFEHQIHWFSIFNSSMMVLFLVGLVAIILIRTLRKDYANLTRDTEDPDEEREGLEETGWKQINGDVFRAPSYLMFFSTLIGTGHQLVLLMFCVIFFSVIGTYYASRGTTVTAFIVCHAFTSFVGGYASGGYFARNGGKDWIKSTILTALFFPGTCYTIACLLNFIAISYHSLAYVPNATMLAVLGIWVFISLPLTVAGSHVGKKWNGTPDHPCRVKQVPRQIPDKPWYMQPWVHVVLGGLLPFGSIFIEMYFIFTSFWHYKYYYVYGFMLLIYIILIIVSVCVTIVSTYFLLNSEDYRWQWISFLASASTAGYVYLYSIYYFFSKTKMSGFFQTAFYFGYMAMFCFGLAILCGSIGFVGSSIFVRRIYQMKLE